MEEDIKILEELATWDNIKLEKGDVAIENILNRLEQNERVIDKLEEKIMYALSPTNSELAIVTKQNFKKIIRENIDQDTYTIKRELKKYWKDEVDYFRKKCE